TGVAYMRRGLVVVLSMLILLWTTVAVPSLAQQSSLPESRIGQYERVLFGGVRTGKPLNQRLNAIEVNVFGKTGRGSLTSRLDAIGKFINPDVAQKLMPQLAPSRDRFAEQDDASHFTQRKKGHVDVSVDAGQGTVLLSQGIAMYKQGRCDEAEHTFQRVLSDDAENPNALYNLGALSERRGGLGGALRTYLAAPLGT